MAPGHLRGLVESRTLTLAGRWVTTPNPGGFVGLDLQSPLVARVQYDVFMQCVHRATKTKEMSGGWGGKKKQLLCLREKKKREENRCKNRFKNATMLTS